MTNGQSRWRIKIEFDDYQIAEINTKDYNDGIKKARKICEAKFG